MESNDFFDIFCSVLNITYFVYLALCIYIKLYGYKQIIALQYGGIVNGRKAEYNRDKPRSINMELAFASLYYCSNIRKSTLKKGIIGAYILKWANEDKISITDKGNKVYSIDLKDGDFFKPDIEQELYCILKDAAGDNNTIDNTEFKSWYNAHSLELDKWHNKILAKAGNISLKPIAEYLLGLRNYLLDYSLMDERRHIEVKLWEEYMIYAQIMGISDKVNKQFGEIYPDYSTFGEIFVLDTGEPMIRLMLLWIFFLIPLGLAIPTSFIVSAIWYVIKP
ncbi:MAG: DUF2207 domain-containing protein [Clostridia bacterium]|nr:DUF2207 domain-containing protein [Clostridia bacterium]